MTMKTDYILTELLAMRARIDTMIDAIKSAPAAPERPLIEPRWMNMNAFCERWSISRGTLYTRIGEGLPVVGEGRNRRIDVKAGDEWMQRRQTRPN
jgi:hypothetical protein